MSDDQVVRLERFDDGVAVITLDRPKANALNRQMLVGIAEAAEALLADPPGAVVVTGGARIFAAGADIAEFAGPSEADEIGRLFHRALGALAAIPRVTIAAVNGYALGGGCELALACDLRYASSTAKLGQPEILLGIIPGGGGTQRLPRLIGASRAKELILSGRQVSADEALTIGLVNKVVDGDATEAARADAAAFAAGPRAAHALAKRAIDDGLETSLDAGLSTELALFAEVFATDDATIGVQSFLEHGPGQATFTGR